MGLMGTGMFFGAPVFASDIWTDAVALVSSTGEQISLEKFRAEVAVVKNLTVSAMRDKKCDPNAIDHNISKKYLPHLADARDAIRLKMPGVFNHSKKVFQRSVQEQTQNAGLDPRFSTFLSSQLDGMAMNQDAFEKLNIAESALKEVRAEAKQLKSKKD